VVYLLGEVEGTLGASRFLQAVLDYETGPVPEVDFDTERRRAALVRELVRLGLVAAKDLSDGGMVAAAAEMTGDGVGAALDLPAGADLARALFGEWGGRYLLGVPPDFEAAVLAACAGEPLHRLGVAGGTALVVRRGDEVVCNEPVASLARLREEPLSWLGDE
jgi:phosphoribosylformylglycinamidine synthase